MRSPSLLALVAAALLASLTLAACGGSDSTTTVTLGSPDTGSDSSNPVVIKAENGAFDPETVYSNAAPGVVTIREVIGSTGSSIFGGGQGQGQGSGFVISDDGEIATNAHVVTDAAESGASGPIHEAKEVYVQFFDRNQVQAQIVGFDPFADVALLRVDPEGLELHPLTLGSIDNVHVGEPVAAIGSPFGQDQSLSVGVISATDRTIQGLSRFPIEGALQTDAAINPGNSGGPLLDPEGQVIGIDQQINTNSGGNEGVGFAVPIDVVKRSLDQLRAGGDVSYAYIGVTTQDLYPQLADRLGIDADHGAIISRVIDGGPGDDAGLQGGDNTIEFQGTTVRTGGDVITAVNGQQINASQDLPRLISLLNPGDKVTLDVIRDGEHQQIEVTLGERPGP
ncbi:MAG: S1C family serine protease [Solirubrobacterales bacterium]